ncbi:alcohol dehydrogenase catalytic domain-containing protein [Ectothiorhodospiraceae bacterium WFHF3C12]|nr:alcohol dehydrogenase catalytic domain-containing protein [Ectothiorhodospiraceae bacterium WFHF3C12]
MRAVVYHSPGKVTVKEVPAPVLQAPTDALVRVTTAGICGTDLHAVAGHFPGMSEGAIVGHEFVGDVIEVGAAVTTLKTGDHVMSSDFTSCGRCARCARGDNWQCDNREFFGTGSAFGPALAGAQAEIVRVPFADSTLSRVPEGCSDEAAILVADNLATGWAAIERGQMLPGDIVAVLGGGAVGQLTSLSAQAAGAGAVVLIEPTRSRREFAQVNGAIPSDPGSARAVLDRLTEGEGADLVVEAVGSPKALSGAFDLVRRRGQVVSVGAHSDGEWPIPLADCFRREITLGFAIGDSIRLRPRLLRMIVTGMLDPTVVIDRRIRLDGIEGAYEALRQQKDLKTIVNF